MDYLVMCIGNIDGGDDAVGPYIAENLINNHDESLFAIDCGTVPENYTSVVKKANPENIMIIDAIDMNLKSGEIRIVPKEKIGEMTISTHGIPISVLMSYLEQYFKNIFLIGIQPEVMSGKMTYAVKKSADILVKMIKNRDIDKIKILK